MKLSKSKRVKPGTSSFVDHPFFDDVRPYLYLSPSGQNFRIQLKRRNLSGPMRTLCRTTTMPCVNCGKTIHPLRNGRYFAATCSWNDGNLHCSRTANASIEYFNIQRALS